MNKYIINLNLAKDIQKIGGKASNLGELIRKKFPVPNGFIISVENFDNNLQNDNLIEVFETLSPPFIVRSSATIEDSMLASFAGQFESYHPINKPSELLEALNKIRELRHSKKISNYIKHYNIPSDDFKIAAIIQEYKNPIYSGVIFINNSQKEITIELSSQQEGVVSGLTTPSKITVDYISKKITSKNDQIEYPEDFINELIDLAIDIKSKFRKPQDIEWVFDGKKIWIVQARPITVPINESSKTIKKELNKLEKIFGKKPPLFVANQFAESMEFATPLTTSLFQRFFSSEGSLGQVLNDYHIPYKKFNAKKYVASIFGRLFLNKDYEKQFLFYNLPCKTTETDVERFGISLNQVKWYYPGFIKLTRMIPNLIYFYIGDVKFRIDAFKTFKRPPLWQKDEKEINNHSDIEAIGKISDHLVFSTVPRLLKMSLFQQFALSYLEKKVKSKISKSSWEKIIRTGANDIIYELANKQGKNNNELLKRVAHRGFQELELSQPRWGESPETFFQILKTATGVKKKINNKNSSLPNHRERVIEIFPSIWDQQIISTFFSLYDAFSFYREQLHDSWVKEMTSLRTVLLSIDRKNKLYNNIWYLTLDELLDKNNHFNAVTLHDRKIAFEAMIKIPISGEIRTKKWHDLLHFKKPTGKSFAGTGLSSGYTKGIAGTIEMLNNNEKVDILLTKNLEPAITIYFDRIKGIITEVGGQLAHATIIAREFGIPVINLNNATKIIDSHKEVILNGDNGNVIIVK